MIKFHPAIEQEKSIRTDCIERAENRSHVARVLRRDNCDGAPQWLKLIELYVLLLRNRKDSLRVVLPRQ